MRQANRSTAAVLHGSDLQSKGRADVFRVRERTRKRRLRRLLLFLGLLDGYLWYRYITDNPLRLPTVGPEAVIWAPILVLVLAIGIFTLMPMFSGRSPHAIVRPEEIEVGDGDADMVDPPEHQRDLRRRSPSDGWSRSIRSYACRTWYARSVNALVRAATACARRSSSLFAPSPEPGLVA